MNSPGQAPEDLGEYVELQCASHFSLLRGASSPGELFDEAARLGYRALAICDRNSLAGLVRAHIAAKETGVRLIVGCELVLRDRMTIVVLPTDRPAYSRLSRMLSLGKTRAGKGGCDLDLTDLAAHAEGLIAILVPEDADETTAQQLHKLAYIFGPDAHVALTLRRRPGDALRLYELEQMALAAGVTPVVTNRVLFHEKERRLLQDVVTCIREGTTIDDVGFKRDRHADRYLKTPAEILRLFPRHRAAVAASVAIAQRCRFSLSELSYQYPREVVADGETAQQTLERLTWEGAAHRFPDGLTPEVRRILQHELQLIGQLGYAPYFLTVNSIVRYSKSQDILCQGRGSAANSAVCYVLGITSIDPERNDLLFERFVSAERDEPPDIDVDFEHARRETVMQWIFETYGRHRSAIVAVVQRFRPRGAVRDVGKVLGLPEDMTKGLSSQIWSFSREDIEEKHARDMGLDLSDRRLRLTLELAQVLLNTPRHFGQHPGGFVLTHDRLDELVPIEPARMKDRQIIEWDKDDIDELKFMKVDVLGLGMMTCLKRGLDLLKDAKGIALDLATIPPEDPRTYAMIRRADTLGVFQIESRAQMAMLPRLKPRSFYDLVIEVAIVRPGPIQGDMVHPYLRRREGKEPVTFPKPELEKVLGKTLGVPLFQEQAMRVAIECAGFTPGEADQLRRAMATFKFTGGVSHFKDKLVGGMVERGYPLEFAEQTFTQLEGFGSYGFPESHAASFALLAYASSWLKCHHPDVFCAALLNSQPMGFYQPAQIVRDAIEHGVEVRPICINASRWDCILEETSDGSLAVRLGLRMVRKLSELDAARLVMARAEEPYGSIDEVWRRAQIGPGALSRLAEADAFRPSLGLARREAGWKIKGLRDVALPLFDQAKAPELNEPAPALKAMTEGREIVEDYGHVGLSLRRHPLALLREELAAQGYRPCQAAASGRDRQFIKTAGLVLVRQMPGTAKGVMFMTLEDESGVSNLVIWKTLYEKQRRVALSAHLLGVEGYIQREGDVVHLVAYKLHDLGAVLSHLQDRGADAGDLSWARRSRNFC
ncbi:MULTISPECIES: error-prone DNA polymerase [unclassified Caulobacter]|jgi:error-prone DNA polymerase|uniref:error-prone DNA polymerase n=1 Tax=unclassified Caulobacter TaxID=2648921 RepID=UPI000782FF95|nr:MULTISPECIES: error-prone DNA polymerase [unclassified Caulobacter]AZS21713.1 DNA polymerase III subunit alpha [Caulobacter sp. FWC26]